MENYLQEKDRFLIRAIINDSQSAFKQLFDSYYDYAMEVACLYCNIQDAEEIVGDVFTRIWHNRNTLQEVNNFQSYLFISLKNQSLNYLRKKKISTVEIADVFDWIEIADFGPHLRLEEEDLRKKVEEAIEFLPPKCQEAFKLVKQYGLKYKEAAAQLAISENTLDVHLKKATKRILEVIRNYSKILVFVFFDICK